LHQNASFEVRVYQKNGANLKPADDIGLVVSGEMPGHHHGLTEAPLATRISSSAFTVDGLNLHMPGPWEIYLDLMHGRTVERAQFDVNID
jgi:hypothetical protein